MRSTDEQLREIMKRADHIQNKRTSQKAIVSYALAACACMALFVVASLYLPGLSAAGNAEGNVHYGSLLLNTSYMGYVVIGVLAFLLGVCVTLLCLHLRRLRKKERDRS